MESTTVYTKEEKDKQIKAEKNRLLRVFSDIGEDKRNVIGKLIDESAFMAVSLSEAREIINRDGMIETYQNGANQSGIKKSAMVEVYDKMVNTYAKIIKQLCDLMPDAATQDASEDIMKFALDYKK